MLNGFDAGAANLRRVGRTLLRQLKLRYCRIVDQPQFASLIVIPEGHFSDDEIKELARSARPDVEIISLLSVRQAMSTSHQISAPSQVESTTAHQSPDAPAALEDQIKITYLKRPLFPSVIRRIVRPPRKVEQPNEVYRSDVVGGDEAREERGAGGGGSGGGRGGGSTIDTDGVLLPSPPDPEPGVSVSARGSVGSIGSIGLDDKWSTDSAEAVECVGEGRAQAPSDKSEPRVLNGSSPASPEGIITDLVASPPAPGRPHIETHITELPPLRDAMARMTLKPGRSEESITTDGQPAAMKVLVVEDNAVNRRIVVAMLKRTVSQSTTRNHDEYIADVSGLPVL